MGRGGDPLTRADTLTFNQLAWAHLALFGIILYSAWSVEGTDSERSSAKDLLTGQNVAVKKIMKPFSTPVLSKRTYRELKLLKHLKHENVSGTSEHRRECLGCLPVERSSRSVISSFRLLKTCKLSDKFGPIALN